MPPYEFVYDDIYEDDGSAFNAAEDRIVAEDIEKRYEASAICQVFEAVAKRLLPGWGEK